MAATSASTVVGVMTPRNFAPAAKGPSSFIPNQLPNSFESVSALQTLLLGALSKTFFSMRSVCMCNLLVASYLDRCARKCNYKVARATPFRCRANRALARLDDYPHWPGNCRVETLRRLYTLVRAIDRISAAS